MGILEHHHHHPALRDPKNVTHASLSNLEHPFPSDAAEAPTTPGGYGPVVAKFVYKAWEV